MCHFRERKREGGREKRKGRKGKKEGGKERRGRKGERKGELLANPFLLLLVMGIRSRLFVELEEVSKVIQREMPFHVLLFVYHTTAESFLVRLTLENLLLN